MRWHPLSVHTGSDSCPTSSANAASSKGFCIWPRSKYPRSPPRLALEQSERLVAKAERVSSPDWILVWYSWIMARASSFVRVIFSYTPQNSALIFILFFFSLALTDNARPTNHRITHFFPRTRSTRVLVLDEQMTGSHALFIAHRRGVPPTLLSQRIKVVVFAICAWMTDFPVWRQFLLACVKGRGAI